MRTSEAKAISLRDEEDRDISLNTFHIDYRVPEASPSCRVIVIAFTDPEEGIPEALKMAMLSAAHDFQKRLLEKLQADGPKH